MGESAERKFQCSSVKNEGDVRFYFLKTMWSDLIILQGDHETAMIDTGTEDQFPMLRDRLERLGIRELSFILLTHFHRDHYGCIPALLEQIPVGRVYFKDYSGLDAMTSWGAPADDAYRQKETETCQDMKELIRRKSTLIPCEETPGIEFEGHPIQLFANENRMRAIYEDQTRPETFHQYAFSENVNSLAALLTVCGRKVFFGGDVHDMPASHPLADRVNLGIARETGGNIDLYKAPHHGTNHTGLADTMRIYRPRYTVITNGLEYLPPDSEIFQNLKAVRPDARVYLTEKQDVAFAIGKDGAIRLISDSEPCPLP